MTSVYYTSLSGMMAASYGLQNTSNNITNMQSMGYKRSDVFYSSLGNQGDRDHPGQGVAVAGHNVNYSAGNYLETNNASDLAVVGNGFFIVRLKNGELLYTRDGEFSFNQDHLLVDKHSGGLVQGYDAKGGLVSIHQLGSKTSPGKATHSIDLKGEFIIIELEKDPNIPENSDPFSSQFEAIKLTVADVYDDQGRGHQIHLCFEAPKSLGTGKNPRDNLEWDLISATCDDADISFDPQSIHFNYDSDGTAEEGFNKIKLNINHQQSVNLNFGGYMDQRESGVRLYKKNTPDHINSSVEVKKQDGFGEGRQIGFSFDDHGLITYEYDNGQFETGEHIALAVFDDLEHSLVQAFDNLFRAKSTQGMTIGRANTHNFGSIQAKKLETSNVDSTIEFGNIVILQRMFQACSQIMDIDKQLLEELYDK